MTAGQCGRRFRIKYSNSLAASLPLFRSLLDQGSAALGVRRLNPTCLPRVAGDRVFSDQAEDLIRGSSYQAEQTLALIHTQRCDNTLRIDFGKVWHYEAAAASRGAKPDLVLLKKHDRNAALSKS
jgi:hypothetical protein